MLQVAIRFQPVADAKDTDDLIDAGLDPGPAQARCRSLAKGTAALEPNP